MPLLRSESREKGTRKGRTALPANSTASLWESDVLEKLKRLIRQSGKSLETVFGQFDSSSTGVVSKEEFHRAMKLLSLGLSDAEISKMMSRLDANADGSISYAEFAAKLRDNKHFEQRMKARAGTRLAQLKQLMV
jgi:Ca2+-binding EF-hand superfamily protein